MSLIPTEVYVCRESPRETHESSVENLFVRIKVSLTDIYTGWGS